MNVMDNKNLPFTKPAEGGKVTVDFSGLVNNNAAPAPPIDLPKKRGRPPKTQHAQEVVVNPIVTEPGYNTPTMVQSNTPYMTTYNEPMALIRGSIGEIDSLNGVVRNQLDAVVDSKTLRKKYEYVSELSSTSANLIGTKIRAITEMNKVISDSHKLDLQRVKDLKLSAAADESNSDKRIQDMYTAFINTPMGSYGLPVQQFPTMQDLTMPNPQMLNAQGGIDITGTPTPTVDPGFEVWKQNMSPEQNRMIMEQKNPNIQTVVVYDQTTNNKYFDVIDRTTGQSIPNMPKPDPYLLADTYPNINNMTARNSNIDTVYPLVLTGVADSLQNF